jgi:hypothetical protein
MAHAVTPHFLHGNFDTAFFAHDAFVFHALILATQAFIVLHGTENARTEQTIAFGLERPVIDRLRLFDFPVRPAKYLIRARKRYANPIEGRNFLTLLEDVYYFLVHQVPLSPCSSIKF